MISKTYNWQNLPKTPICDLNSKEKKKTVNSWILIPQLNGEVLSLTFKYNLHHKDDRLHTALYNRHPTLKKLNDHKVLKLYSTSWLENYLFCSSSSSFLFTMARIAWRSSSKNENGEKGKGNGNEFLHI